MKNLNVSFKPVGHLVRRYHLTIFIVFVVASLGYAVFNFTDLFGQSPTNTTTVNGAPASSSTINQATLDKLKTLHTSDEPTPALVVPSGRTNPFSE